MPHIDLPEHLPGIRSAMAFRPETAKPLNELVEVLLRGPNSLSAGERELIATYVSSLNDCYYCQMSHGAIAAANVNYCYPISAVAGTRVTRSGNLSQLHCSPDTDPIQLPCILRPRR